MTSQDEFSLELTKVANGGDMMGRYDGKVVFVPYTIPGEAINAVFTEENKGYARAAATTWAVISPDRVEAPCPHYGPGLCGGCHWQHIDYARQLDLKRAVVVDQLKRIGKVEEPTVHLTIPSPKPWHYRAHLTFSLKDDGSFAFWNDDNTALEPIDICLIMDEALADLYHEVNLTSPDIEQVRFQVGSELDDLMIVLYSQTEQAPELALDLPVSVNLLLPDNEPINLIGKAHVTYTIKHRNFRVTAGGFFQTNQGVTELLVEGLLEQLDLQGHETVLDLYAGVGLFTSFIAEQAEHVVSVESYPPAVTDADINMAEMDNVDLVEGPVEGVLPDLIGPFDAVVLDPPRSGLDASVIDELARLEPPLIVYVSCDVATLARDIKRFQKKGFRLVDVQPYDMFPQTYHVENIAVLRL